MVHIYTPGSIETLWGKTFFMSKQATPLLSDEPDWKPVTLSSALPTLFTLFIFTNYTKNTSFFQAKFHKVPYTFLRVLAVGPEWALHGKQGCGGTEKEWDN